MRIPSARMRRLRGPAVPKGASTAYRRLLVGFFDEFLSYVEKQLLEGWESNPAHFSGAVPRADASTFVTKKLGAIQLHVAERFDPGTQLSRDVRVVAARVNAKNNIEFQRVVGVTMRSAITGPDGSGAFLLDAFRDTNVNLIKSLQGQALDDITTLLGEAESGAWRVEDLRKKIQAQFDVTKSKASLLARDQVLKLNGQLTKTRQQNAGVDEYIWTTSGDERVRDSHAALDGQRCRWDSPPVVSEDGRTGHPGEDYQCRCTAYPILPELDDEDEQG